MKTVLVLALALVATGCVSGGKVKKAMAAAARADAERRAPYEWTMARLYAEEAEDPESMWASRSAYREAAIVWAEKAKLNAAAAEGE